MTFDWIVLLVGVASLLAGVGFGCEWTARRLSAPVRPEAMEAEAGRLLVASARARADRMGPDDAHELRHLLACVQAGNSDDEADGCRLDHLA